MQTAENNKNLKEQILEVAGYMFLECGYHGTTFQKIADKLGITKGSITYHFKNKFVLVEIFIDEYFTLLNNFIDSFPDENKNSYLKHSTKYIYAYRSIMSSPICMDLFYHKDQQAQWQKHKINVVSQIYEDIERDFHKSYDIADLQMKVYIDMGARAKLFSVYKENPGIFTLDQYCYYHVYLIGILCKLDESTIQENIKNAFAFVNAHTPPKHFIFNQ